MHLAQTAADFQQTAANSKYMLFFDPRGNYCIFFCESMAPKLVCTETKHKNQVLFIATLAIFFINRTFISIIVHIY